ncbi:MAG: hypothetical protein IJE83_06360 [Oscillospiraceae bacterium]|nr:hypothetical protein [Oscillospiraceae bacterium]
MRLQDKIILVTAATRGIGRKAVLDFIKNTVGAVNYKYSPTNAELFDFRQKLNAAIAKHKAAGT